MDFKIHCSPIINITEIIPRFFNVNKISDVQFIVGHNTMRIYAHSFVLMAQSKLFEQQMEHTLFKKKIIRIVDYKYASFLEFIRFIYTDECTINDDNGLELLKLAVKYKLVKLENRVLNSLKSINWLLQLFEHCVVDKYPIPYFFRHNLTAANYGNYLKDVNFEKLHPDALKEFLKFDRIGKNLTEFQIFNAVGNWVYTYCKTHFIPLSEGRTNFYNLIRQIRFLTMTHEELKKCVKKYPELLNKSDCASIASQLVFGSNDDEDLWLSTARMEFVWPFESIIFKCGEESIFETVFIVTRQTILNGLVIGVEDNRKKLEVEISNSTQKERLIFTQNSPAYWDQLTIWLGDSIHLKANIQYSIRIKYLELTDTTMKVKCRKEKYDLTIHDPDNSVQKGEQEYVRNVF